MFVAADLQRVDLGIALSHFAFTAAEAGLEGSWVIEGPGLKVPDEGVEYVVSWAEAPGSG
jgi:hypothetical protein